MEFAFIDWLRQRLPAHPCLRVGPGDDAAVLQLRAGRECVVTVDMLTDGVDFELANVDPKRVGRKALAVNLSDLAAMAARPLAGVIALALPRRHGLETAMQLYEGLLPLAAEHGLVIAGGDTNTWGGPLVISVTLMGEPTARGCLLRSGAQPGDDILVTGQFGGSILGKNLDFEPRVREALTLAEKYPLRAAIDVSDGLSLDLARLARESRCGAVIDPRAVPVAPAAVRWAEQLADGSTGLDHALSDGEDFELILAAAPAVSKRILNDRPFEVPITRIGSFTPELGLWQVTPDGRREALQPKGYEH
jgi:thiamine-monophosphate kinase